MTDTDVLIVGAGLAGLNCARHLQQHGIPFQIFEASDGVGGRVRTDEVDGFRLDRGFQVLLTAYPETQAALDYRALDLRPFYEGALIRTGGQFHRLADPFRRPLDAPATLLAPVGSLLDKVQVGWLRWNVVRGSVEDLFQRPEVTTLDALRRRWGFSEQMIDAFFRPFLGGILLDRDLQASSRMFEFVFRMFSKGATAIPAAGMEAIPQQLAASLPPPSIHLETPVARVEPGRLYLEGGQQREARAVVVATEAPEAARLLGRDDANIQTSGRSTVTLYYTTDVPPLADPVLVLGADPSEGPINNLVVLTNAAPEYAPGGQSLVSVSVVGKPDEGDDAIERQVRQQLVTWFGSPAAQWRHLRTYRIPYALPEQAPPFLTPPERPLKLQEGLYVCGDHRRTASINGAMAAGRHAATRIAQDLAAQESTRVGG